MGLIKPGVYEFDSFPLAQGYLPIVVDEHDRWYEVDFEEDERYEVVGASAKADYLSSHGPVRELTLEEAEAFGLADYA